MKRYLLIVIIGMVLMPTVLLAETTDTAPIEDAAVQGDPKLLLAKQTKNDIEDTERSLAQQEQEAFLLIEEAICQIPSDTFTADHNTMDGFCQVTGILHQLARQILAKRDGIVTDIDKLNRLTQTAAHVFREASKTFEEYAKEEPYEEIQEDYKRLAGIWDILAKTLDKRIGQYDTENAEMKKMLQYLERIAIFLDRLNQHFESLPNTASIEEREKYMADLKRFIKSFERLRSLFHDFDNELRANALAKDLPSAKTILESVTNATAPQVTMAPPATPKRPFYKTTTFIVIVIVVIVGFVVMCKIADS